MILLTEYARMHGRDRSVVLRKAQRGQFKTAVKSGRYWLIDEREPYPRDHRFKKNNDQE